MKHIILPVIAALASMVFFLAFKPNPTAGMSAKETPGIIQVIGNAGSDQVFTFEKWQFTKAKMKDDEIGNIELEAEIDCRSLTGGWDDLVKSVKKKKDYFNVSKFPTASVVVNGAEDLGDGTWVTNAEVTIKKYTREVPLTFTISEEKPFVVKGNGQIKRRKFGFTGGGPKNEVPVIFEATLPIK